MARKVRKSTKMETSASSHISNHLHVLSVFDKLILGFQTAKKKLTIKTGLAIDSLRSCNSNVKENVNSKSNFVLLQVFWDYSIPRPLLNITSEAKSPHVGALISINSWE